LPPPSSDAPDASDAFNLGSPDASNARQDASDTSDAFPLAIYLSPKKSRASEAINTEPPPTSHPLADHPGRLCGRGRTRRTRRTRVPRQSTWAGTIIARPKTSTPICRRFLAILPRAGLRPDPVRDEPVLVQRASRLLTKNASRGLAGLSGFRFRRMGATFAVSQRLRP